MKYVFLDEFTKLFLIIWQINPKKLPGKIARERLGTQRLRKDLQSVHWSSVGLYSCVPT